VERAMMALGREIELIQRHKAEADLAVAAASILARHEFVTRLDQLGRKFAVTMPKGASTAVIAAGRKFVEAHGVDRLGEVAKLHFRTTQIVSGGASD
jgi:ribonuclease HIII